MGWLRSGIPKCLLNADIGKYTHFDHARRKWNAPCRQVDNNDEWIFAFFVLFTRMIIIPFSLNKCKMCYVCVREQKACLEYFSRLTDKKKTENLLATFYHHELGLPCANIFSIIHVS